MAHWQHYLIAVVIGLLVGVERERVHTGTKSIGVRTFVLISLLGALASDMPNIGLALVVASFSLGLIFLSYYNLTKLRKSQQDPGLTTEFAAGIVFSLSYTAQENPALSAVLGPLIALILFSKSKLHKITHSIKPAEFQAALLLLLSFVAVINLLPDQAVDPWRIFNPQKFGYLVLILAALEFSSYITIKVLGQNRGLLVVGFVGGFVSSTAILISMVKKASETPTQWRSYLSAAIAAKVAALIELLIIVGLASPQLLQHIVPSIGVSIIVAGVAILLIARGNQKISPHVDLKSPLDWVGVMRLAVLLAAILAVVTYSKSLFGEGSIQILSFIMGFFELHGISLANATLFNENQLSEATVVLSIQLATIGSLFAKIILSWILTRSMFSRMLSVAFLSTIVAVAAFAYL